MNLYFLDKDDKQYLVAMEVAAENAVEIALSDLYKRYPEVKSYYQRVWWDEFHRMWIDYGSHIEFYLLQEEKYALNVVAECNRYNRDYCNIEEV